MGLWAQDGPAIALLIFLYILQGIPLGLCASIPYLLTSQGISYEDQALFSFTFWPFSLKLIWAPIVDGLYFRKLGRRKTWLVPTQYFLGFMMLWLSRNVESLMQGSITKLTACFFLLNFGAATQDVAVDGWCLTMLSEKNRGWASTCNAVGQSAGYFLGYAIFLAFESVDFSNNWVRPTIGLESQDFGILTLPKFMFMWGVIFIIATTVVGILKTEVNDEDSMGVWDTYKSVGYIFRIKQMITYVAFTLTSRIGMCATDALTGLKLIEKGVPRENMALLAIPLTPISIILPLIISKYTAGPTPLKVWRKAYLPRLFMGLVFAWLIHLTSQIGTKSGNTTSFPPWYYALVVVLYIFSSVISTTHYVAIMAFHARISDVDIGGTYMTLLNTLTNLGGNWPQTSALWLVDKISSFDCLPQDSTLNSTVTNWNDKSLSKSCSDAGGEFITTSDGYFYEVFACSILGCIWLKIFWKTMENMDKTPKKSWHVRHPRQD